MKGVDAIAAAVRTVFRKQRSIAARGRERFGDFIFPLAKALQGPMETLYLSAAKGAKAKGEYAPHFAALARQRAVEVAREVNATTSLWVQEGRDEDSIFGDSRVVMIAETEATYARSAGLTLVAGMTRQKLRWVCNVGCCKECKKLNGKKVKAGDSFGIINGRDIRHPGVHPFCRCKVEVVA